MKLDFSKISKIQLEVIPVVVQDATSKEVLIIGYANEEAVSTTIETKLATLWSTSRNELWIKGKTSGNSLEVVEIRVNCEDNSLLYLVNQNGEGACHTKDESGKARTSCFYRTL